MKTLTAALLIGAAASMPHVDQQPMQKQQPLSAQFPFSDLKDSLEDGFLAKPLEILSSSLDAFTSEAKQLWSDLAAEFPQAVEDFSFFSSPKKHSRRPDGEWDHIVRGADVQGVWVQGADGEKHREVGGRLEDYDLRVKKVDPSKLGVDPDVKQYSGYLDDNDADKHLFYCKCSTFAIDGGADCCRVLRVSQ